MACFLVPASDVGDMKLNTISCFVFFSKDSWRPKKRSSSNDFLFSIQQEAYDYMDELCSVTFIFARTSRTADAKILKTTADVHYNFWAPSHQFSGICLQHSESIGLAPGLNVTLPCFSHRLWHFRVARLASEALRRCLHSTTGNNGY